MKCPKCKINLLNPSECLECGWTAKQVGNFKNELPPAPKICMVTGCENESAMTFLYVVNDEGKVLLSPGIDKIGYRKEGKYYLHGGYTFSHYIIRCADCFLHEQHRRKQDWREAMLIDHQHRHPEFAVVPKSDDERRDMIAMAKAYRPVKLPYNKNQSQVMPEISEEDIKRMESQRPVIDEERVKSVDVTKYLAV